MPSRRPPGPRHSKSHSSAETVQPLHRALRGARPDIVGASGSPDYALRCKVWFFKCPPPVVDPRSPKRPKVVGEVSEVCPGLGNLLPSQAPPGKVSGGAWEAWESWESWESGAYASPRQNSLAQATVDGGISSSSTSCFTFVGKQLAAFMNAAARADEREEAGLLVLPPISARAADQYDLHGEYVEEECAGPQPATPNCDKDDQVRSDDDMEVDMEVDVDEAMPAGGSLERVQPRRHPTSAARVRGRTTPRSQSTLWSGHRTRWFRQLASPP